MDFRYKINRLGILARHLWAPLLRAGSRLPPGSLRDASEPAWRARDYLERLALQHGPVFKARINDEMVLCVVGIPLGRRLLRDHRSDLLPITIDISSLAGAGFMRQMQGDAHHLYRRAVQEALARTPWREHPGFPAIARDVLANYARAGAVTPDAWFDALTDVATSSLIELFFDQPTGSSQHAELRDAFQEFGPSGIAWNLGERQFSAFRRVRRLLIEQSAEGGVIGQLRTMQALDDTLLANLIFMVEMGRYDMRALFRWLSKHAADHPETVAQIRQSRRGIADDATCAEQLVLETLRTDQSERLMRRCLRSFEFEGHRFPKGATVRVCLWESHNGGGSFDRPKQFCPYRFSGPPPGPDRFSPFGLDHHQCPFASPAVHLGTVFVDALSDYELQEYGGGPAIRGAYHWEPPSEFTVRLKEPSQ